MDGQLSPKGFWEVEQVALRLKDTEINACYTSDLKRAADTCACIAAKNKRFDVTLDTRLRERFFGSMQGKVFPPYYDETEFPPETETVSDMANRLSDLIDELIDRHSETDKTILLVSHGFTIRVLIALLRELPLDQVWSVSEILNTSVSIFDYLNGKGWLECLFNDVSHIDERRG